MTRSIYTRILVWFWLANAGITMSILSITLISGAQPLGRRWLAASLELMLKPQRMLTKAAEPRPSTLTSITFGPRFPCRPH